MAEPQEWVRTVIEGYNRYGEMIARRLRVVLFIFIGAWVVGLGLAPHIFRLLLPSSIDLVIFNYADGLGVLLRVAFLFAAVVAFPAVVMALMFILRDIRDALPPAAPGSSSEHASGREAGVHPVERIKRTMTPVVMRRIVLVAAGLFALGLAFGGFVLFPLIMRFITQLSGQLDIVPLFGAVQYFSFLVGLVLPVALFFELPLAIVGLVAFKLVPLQKLKRIRKYVYFFLYVLASMITPPEVLTHIMAALPLIALYEVGLFFAGRLARE